MSRTSPRKRNLPPEFVTTELPTGETACSALIVDNSSSRPTKRRNANHPEHQLVYVLVNDNRNVDQRALPKSPNEELQVSRAWAPWPDPNLALENAEIPFKDSPALATQRGGPSFGRVNLINGLRHRHSDLQKAGGGAPRRIDSRASLRERRAKKEQTRIFRLNAHADGPNGRSESQVPNQMVFVEASVVSRVASQLRPKIASSINVPPIAPSARSREENINESTTGALAMLHVAAPTQSRSSNEVLSPVWSEMLHEHMRSYALPQHDISHDLSEIPSSAARNGGLAAVDVDPEKDASTSVYYTYRLTERSSALNDTNSVAQAGESSGLVGKIVFAEEEIAAYEGFVKDVNGDSDSYDEDDGDSNDERNPRNEYPDEDEVESIEDGEDFRRQSTRSRGSADGSSLDDEDEGDLNKGYWSGHEGSDDDIEMSWRRHD